MPALSKFVNNATIKLPLKNLHKTKYYGCVLFEKTITNFVNNFKIKLHFLMFMYILKPHNL